MSTTSTLKTEINKIGPLVRDDLRSTAAIPYTLVACLNQRNELLMIRRNKPPFVGQWNFIGGKINLGETPLSAAIREIREEANRESAPKNVTFKGIALWPDSSDREKYLGMFLFFLNCKVREDQSKQLGLLHEGVTAWISLDQLTHPSEFTPVPNFQLILSHFLTTRERPQVFCHCIDDTDVYENWRHRIAPKNRMIADRPLKSHFFNVSDLIDDT